ncbi:MAG: M15 family metallopeptidase [Flavobacteriaceae bacterium]
MNLRTFIVIFIGFFFLSSFFQKNLAFPKGFVDASDIVPNLKKEIRYATKNNFIGKPINGYTTDRCVLTKQAALALEQVNITLEELGLCVYIYDSYRPQKAVNQFVTWARAINDTLMKQQFYPNVAKKNLFKKGYIASKSRHSSGSTVDLTLFSDSINDVLDMGSTYDFFGEQSWVNYNKLSKVQIKNRQLLQRVMNENGFRSYPKEWWHFTLRYEPYRNVYFDFEIE